MGPGRCAIGSADVTPASGRWRSTRRWSRGLARRPASRASPLARAQSASSTRLPTPSRLRKSGDDLARQGHPRHGEVAGRVAGGHVTEVDDCRDPAVARPSTFSGWTSPWSHTGEAYPYRLVDRGLGCRDRSSSATRWVPAAASEPGHALRILHGLDVPDGAAAEPRSRRAAGRPSAGARRPRHPASASPTRSSRGPTGRPPRASGRTAWLHARAGPADTCAPGTGAWPASCDWGDLCAGDPAKRPRKAHLALVPVEHHDVVWPAYGATDDADRQVGRAPGRLLQSP